MMETFADSQVIDELMQMLDTCPTVTAIEYNAQSQSTLIQKTQNDCVIMKLNGGQKQTSSHTNTALKALLRQHISQIRFINATSHGLNIARFSRQAIDAWTLTLQKNTAGAPINLKEAQALLSNANGHC